MALRASLEMNTDVRRWTSSLSHPAMKGFEVGISFQNQVLSLFQVSIHYFETEWLELIRFKCVEDRIKEPKNVNNNYSTKLLIECNSPFKCYQCAVLVCTDFCKYFKGLLDDLRVTGI